MIKFTDRHIAAGLTLFLIADFFIIVMSAFAKGAAVYHDPVEILFYRSLVAMFMLLLFAGAMRRKNLYRTKRIKAHLWRAVVGNGGMALGFWALALMPMADITALTFTAPLMVTALSALFLHEHVGPRRWVAVALGFAGVLVLANPAGQDFSTLGVVIALMCALCNALVIIALRDLGRTEDALTTVFYFLAFGILFSGVYMLFRGHAPAPGAWWLLIGTGIAGGLQLILKTQAYRMAEASFLSPFAYLSLLWAALLGWMFWHDVPTVWTAAGAAIIIGSNFFVIWRKRKARAAA